MQILLSFVQRKNSHLSPKRGKSKVPSVTIILSGVTYSGSVTIPPQLNCQVHYNQHFLCNLIGGRGRKKWLICTKISTNDEVDLLKYLFL